MDRGSGTDTDDIYFQNPDGTYISSNSNIVTSTGSFFGGQYQTKLKGSTSGCNDVPGGTIDITCRGAAIFVNGAGGPNTVSSVRLRVQNDNNSSLRVFQLAFELSYIDQLITNNRDYGDANNSYGSAGALVSSNLSLGYGVLPDNEADHQFSGNASGDDNFDSGSASNFDDEDGVRLNNRPLDNQSLNTTASLDVTTFGTGFLSAWLDLDGDGNFSGADEQIVDDFAVTSSTVATNSLPITVPASATAANTKMRFRFSAAQNVNATGFTSSGEVEDYQVSLNTSTSTTLNPDYTQDCNSSIKIALVLDASGSINGGGGVQAVRNGVKGLIDEIAENTPGTEIGIVEFAYSADTPIPFTPVNSATATSIFEPYINADGISTASTQYYDGRHDIWTNWEASMIQVNSDLSEADALIFVTDGVPNKYVDDNGNLQPPNNTLVNAATGIAETVPWTDQIKARGTHIYGFGISNNVSEDNFKPITENTANFELYNNTIDNAETADYAFVQQFSDFANQLTFLIQDICQLGDNPNLALVKRITGINPDSGRSDEQDFSSYYVDVTDGSSPTDDNDTKWPGTQVSPNEGSSQVSDYLRGETEDIVTKPNDEIEYAIYLLSNGNNTTRNVLVCDLIPENTEFVANAFGSSAAGVTGIQWEYNGQIENLTNSNDSDAGYYFPPGIEPTSVSGLENVKCAGPNQPNPPNTTGAIVVNVGNLPRASLPGDPTNSYGFIRFRAKVK